MQVEREASMPVMLEPAAPNRRQRRVPAKFVDMLPTSLKGLPHLRLKPGLAAPADHRSNRPPPPTSTPHMSLMASPPSIPISGAPRRPPAVVEDDRDEWMDDVRPVSPSTVPAVAPPPAPPLVPQPPPATVDTQPNRFGVFRRYTARPHSDPEEGLTLDAFATTGTHLRPPPDPRECDPLRPFDSTARKWLSDAGDVAANSFAPFLKWSAFKLMEWQYTGSMTKSAAELQRLVDKVIMDERFKKEDLVGFNVERAQVQLDAFTTTNGAFSAEDGWREGTVWLRLPKRGAQHDDEDSAPGYYVKGIWHRSFLETIKSAFRDPIARNYHWFPHRLLRKHASAEDPNIPPERLISDVYNSDAMAQAHEEVQQLPRHPDDAPEVEYIVAGIGVYSDSTRLANFGTASLWPVYAYILNMSKYLHLKPTMFAAHHLAYIPSVGLFALIIFALSDPCFHQLPDGLFATYQDIYEEPPTMAVIQFLKHELVKQVWLLLLDDDFLRAYKHGILILCGDGILRRVFPRVFFYSTDYPEKYVALIHPTSITNI